MALRCRSSLIKPRRVTKPVFNFTTKEPCYGSGEHPSPAFTLQVEWAASIHLSRREGSLPSRHRADSLASAAEQHL